MSPEVRADIQASIIITLTDLIDVPVNWTAEELHQFFNQAEPTERSDVDTVLAEMAKDGIVTIDAETGAVNLNPEKL